MIALLKRVPPWLWVTLGGLVLFLPCLGSYGLWDPYEVSYASQAQELARGQIVLPPGHPPLALLVAAAGVKVLGPSELGGRLPEALAGVLGLLAAYYAASGLFSRRAGLVAAALLAFSPAYLLQSRSMASDVAGIAALTLACGGLGRFALGGGFIHLAAGLIGMALGGLGAGIVSGVIAPGCAVAFACALTNKGRVAPLLLATAGAAGLVFFATPGVASAAFLGGALRSGASPNPFAEALRHVGFAAFPAGAALPLALGTTLVRREDDDRTIAHLVGLAMALLMVSAYAVSSYRTNAELRFLGLGPIAVWVAGSFDEVLDGDSRPLLGLTFAVGLILIGRDFFLYPESFGAAHLRESLHWPVEVRIGEPVLIATALAAITALAGFCIRRPRLRQILFGASLACVLGLAVFDGHMVLPAASRHLSFKSLFDRYRALSGGHAPLRGYRISGQATEYYAHGPLAMLDTPEALGEYLRTQGSNCGYVLAANGDLAGLDQQLRAAKTSYYVVDASSSRFLLLSSCLPPGTQDQNPLRLFVRSEPPSPPPSRTVHADWENKVELIGFDVPSSVSRVMQGKFTITLYYHVKDRLPAGYKVFIHFDGCGSRFHGDHIPLGGKFPTQFWSPGDYIRDSHVVDVPLMTTPSCVYRILTGFFLGDARLKLQPGSPEDAPNTNRVPLGTIVVR